MRLFVCEKMIEERESERENDAPASCANEASHTCEFPLLVQMELRVQVHAQPGSKQTRAQGLGTPAINQGRLLKHIIHCSSFIY